MTIITAFIMAFFCYLFDDAKFGMKKFEKEFGIESAELKKSNSLTFSLSPNSAISKPNYKYHFFLSTFFDRVGGFR